MSAIVQTVDQRRAAHAYSCVQSVEPGESLYRSYVENLPSLIVMNGLGQAVATLRARANGRDSKAKNYKTIHEHLEGWLCRTFEGSPYFKAPSLIEAITSKGEGDYVRAHAEALAYLLWLKKFAQARIGRGKRVDDA